MATVLAEFRSVSSPCTMGEHPETLAEVLTSRMNGGGAAWFEGSQEGFSWRGLVRILGLTSGTAANLAVDGVPLLLEPAPQVSAISVEKATDDGAGSAMAYLWRRLASGRNRLGWYTPPPELTYAVQALVASGHLDTTSIQYQCFERTVIALTRREQPLGDVPRRWLSFCERLNREAFRRKCVGLGINVPPIDDVSLYLEALVPATAFAVSQGATAIGFELYVSCSPPLVATPAIGRSQAKTICWWAQDDLDGWYLGSPCRWHPETAGARSAAVVYFQPAIDPDAKELVLMPSGPTERGGIRVGLSPLM